MLIDWFTVGAQALNFLILVWLLKRFLYGPILDAIDAREKRIAKELADADATKAQAQKEKDEFQHKNEEFEGQRVALFTKVTEEAKSERERLLNEAHAAADALSARRQEALITEQKSLSESLGTRVRDEVFAIARKTLTDLAGANLEERMTAVFTRRLGKMDDKAKADFGAALKSDAGAGRVRSAFELPADQRAVIQNALNETFAADVHVAFETAPDLVSGIELTVNGHKLAWSIADYLASMARSIDELLEQKKSAEAKVGPGNEPKAEVKAEPKAK